MNENEYEVNVINEIYNEKEVIEANYFEINKNGDLIFYTGYFNNASIAFANGNWNNVKLIYEIQKDQP